MMTHRVLNSYKSKMNVHHAPKCMRARCLIKRISVALEQSSGSLKYLLDSGR